MQNTQDRLFFIDFLKAISIVSVVSFHSTFVPVNTYSNSALTLETLFVPLRFCVPVLLVISFFLLEKSFTKKSLASPILLTRKRLYRLLIPTVFWFGLAGLKFIFQSKSLSEMAAMYLQGNIFSGAYYLLILLQFVPIFFLIRSKFRSLKFTASLIVIQSLFFFVLHYIFSLGGYKKFEIVIRNLDKPFFMYWLVYVAIGVFFYHNYDKCVNLSKQLTIQTKSIILISTFILFSLEYRWLYSHNVSLEQPFEYTMFSCIFGSISLFLCFAQIKKKHFNFTFLKLISLLSKYSLGIFCINGIISRFFSFFGKSLFLGFTFNFAEILMIKLFGWIFLLVVSLLLSIFLEKIGLKSVVT